MPNMQQPQCNHQNTLFNLSNQANTPSGSFNFNSFDDLGHLKKTIHHEDIKQHKYIQQNHMNTSK